MADKTIFSDCLDKLKTAAETLKPFVYLRLEDLLGETFQMTLNTFIYQEIETNQVGIELFLYPLMLEIFL